ncbi:hypothetical protein MLD38_003646 [Melastoma candidum]|uniref:Uncharacterized protein n=1 Tax=Melastoma candidum TaxID=119954 RepID=A0ACB9S2R1_9MYRT|nr:hypothetical protein MLD38_003646 [Melastoma candidum]
MCTGSKGKPFPSDFFVMGGDCRQEASACRCSSLLELAASGDLLSFRKEVEETGCDIDGVGLWYGRRIGGSKKMGFQERTPLMMAALFGSTDVVRYILNSGKSDVNRACGSDGTTALHFAVASGSACSPVIVKLLLDAAADPEFVDVNGYKPVDVIALEPSPKSRSSSTARNLRLLLNGSSGKEDDAGFDMVPQPSKGGDKKEYPVDISLPDINTGIYGTDDFRMYTFKVKPCSRAYSHDWTECPFVHPGENARRRDPRKYPYSCVPCPDFRKGSCQRGDVCEYAHGVFESWLHPAQYRTRLCKDEVGCARKVCFFAHKPEELRPVYAATGSALPSPKSYSSNPMENMSPLSLASSSLPLPAASTPPMSPLASSPKAMSMWQSKVNPMLPTPQLPGSRLKTALSARELEVLSLESQAAHHQQQKLMGEMPCLSSPTWKNEFGRVVGDLKSTDLIDTYGSIDASFISQLQGMSSVKASTSTQIQSPVGMQIRQSINQLRAGYPDGISNSPARKSPPNTFDSSSAVAAAVMNSRSSAMTNRSQSFIHRGAVPTRSSLMGSLNPPAMASEMSDWSSPDGKLDWGVHGDELNRLRKSASFGFRDNRATNTKPWGSPNTAEEPDMTWAGSLAKSPDDGMYKNDTGGGGGSQKGLGQVYIEQEQQMVA